MTERTWRHLFGVLLVVMALVTTGQTAWWSWEQQKCNEAFAQNLAKRSRWNDQDRDALNRLIVTIFTRRAEPEQAYRNWVAVTERNQDRRAHVSLPQLADCD